MGEGLDGFGFGFAARHGWECSGAGRDGSRGGAIGRGKMSCQLLELITSLRSSVVENSAQSRRLEPLRNCLLWQLIGHGTSS